METLGFNIWLGLGIFLMIGEFILPGLVVVFIGLGCLTVAGGLYHGFIDTIAAQFILFFSSSILYLVSLRLLVLRFVPTDIKVSNTNEDEMMNGDTALVMETIKNNGFGRVSYSGTTWQARSLDGKEILESTEVQIVKRDNITLVVHKNK